MADFTLIPLEEAVDAITTHFEAGGPARPSREKFLEFAGRKVGTGSSNSLLGAAKKYGLVRYVDGFVEFTELGRQLGRQDGLTPYNKLLAIKEAGMERFVAICSSRGFDPKYLIEEFERVGVDRNKFGPLTRVIHQNVRYAGLDKPEVKSGNDVRGASPVCTINCPDGAFELEILREPQSHFEILLLTSEHMTAISYLQASKRPLPDRMEPDSRGISRLKVKRLIPEEPHEKAFGFLTFCVPRLTQTFLTSQLPFPTVAK